MSRHPWVAEAEKGLRWGVQLITPNERGGLPNLMETGKLVERLGYDAAFIFDHPAVHADPVDRPFRAGGGDRTDPARIGGELLRVSSSRLLRPPGRRSR